MKICEPFYQLTSFTLIAMFFQLSFIGDIHSSVEKKYLDMHVHVACLDRKINCYVNPKLREHWKFEVYLKSMSVTLQELTLGDEIVVTKLSEKITSSKYLKKAVILALDGFYDKRGNLKLEKTELIVPNSFVHGNARKYSNLEFGASIHPYRKDALQALQWAKSSGAVLVKWLPCIMGIDPSSEDPRIEAFYKKLIELDLPLLTHTGNENSFLDSDNKLCNPIKLEKPLKMGVTVIAAHIAAGAKYDGKKGFEILKDMMETYPLLYADISSLTQINKFNFVKLASQIQHRTVYGSDWPLINTKLLGFPLVSHRYYLFHIPRHDFSAIGKLENEFDRDIMLKKSLGVGEDVFNRTWSLLKLRD